MKNNNPAVFLLDGYSLIYRSYFAFINRPLLNSKGENTSAVFGFFRTLLGIFDSYQPEYFGVVLDSRKPTFRHEMFPEYKANREKAPEDLHSQIPVIESVLAEMGINVIRRDGFEADDIIAYYSGLCVKEKRPCYIITGDKDLLQLVVDDVRIMRPDKGSYQILGKNDVFDSWGVRPDQIIDYLALTGDQADNVPGVKGIGPKTAEKLLREYGTLDGIYDKLEEHSAGVRKKLEENRENAYLSRKLVTLNTDCCVTGGLEELAAGDIRSGKAADILRNEGINSLADKLAGTEQGAGSGSNSGGAEDAAPGIIGSESVKSSAAPDAGGNTEPWASGLAGLGERLGIYRGKGEYRTVLCSSELEKLETVLRNAVCFAFDTETDDLDAMKASPVGFSFSTECGKGWYLPLRCGGTETGCLDEDQVRAFLVRVLGDGDLKTVGQNIKYDYKVMKNWGVSISNIHFDTMVAAWLLDSGMASYGMDALAERVLDYKTIKFDDVVPSGETFDKIELEKASEYAAEDADITYRLYRAFEPELAQRNLDRLFREVELPLVRILADMEMEGILIESGKLEEFGTILSDQIAALEKDIFSLCGMEFNINSTKQLQEVLFEKRGLKPVKKTKTGYSTNVQVLEILAEQDPVPEKILEHRSLSKLKSTYVDSLPEMVNSRTGRIHTHFIQTGTATGRLSSRDPNLQNIPIKSDNGRRIREAFIPADGCVFLSADYSQIELVVLAHLSGDEGLSRAFRDGEDVHQSTASLIFNVFPELVTPEQRRIAKTINFGIMYGMSGFRLSRELKIPRKTADEFINAYFSRYSGIRSFIDRIAEEARTTGKVRTLLGRERVIHGINSRNATERAGAERIALNTPIQGSAADIVKLSMLKLSAELEKRGLKSRLVLQVHDELIFEVPDEELETVTPLVTEIMENIVSLDVPLKTSVEYGRRWGDLH